MRCTRITGRCTGIERLTRTLGGGVRVARDPFGEAVAFGKYSTRFEDYERYPDCFWLKGPRWDRDC